MLLRRGKRGEPPPGRSTLGPFREMGTVPFFRGPLATLICCRSALLAACTGSVPLNPDGTDLPRAWLATLAIPLPELIQEHRPLDLGSPLGWTVVLLGLGDLVALAGCWPGRPSRRVPLPACPTVHGRSPGKTLLDKPGVAPEFAGPTPSTDRWAAGVTWLIPLVWFALAVARVRNVPRFAIVAVLAMAETIPRGRWAERLRGHETLVDGDHHEQATGRFGRSWPAAVLPALVVVAAVVLQVTGVDAPVVGRGWARLDPADWPVALLPQLERPTGRNPRQRRSSTTGLRRPADLRHATAAGIRRRPLRAYAPEFPKNRTVPERGGGPARPLAAAIWFLKCVGRVRQAVRP